MKKACLFELQCNLIAIRKNLIATIPGMRHGDFLILQSDLFQSSCGTIIMDRDQNLDFHLLGLFTNTPPVKQHLFALAHFGFSFFVLQCLSNLFSSQFTWGSPDTRRRSVELRIVSIEIQLFLLGGTQIFIYCLLM